jgi:CBS domain containing-hemolysin-like protein
LEPPQPVTLLLGTLPAALAAILAVAGNAAESVSPTRQAALLEVLTGLQRSALQRYLARPAYIRARWAVLQALGLTASALYILSETGNWGWALATSLLTYVGITRIGTALVWARTTVILAPLLAALRPFDMIAIPVADPLAFLSELITRPLKRSIPPSSTTESEVEMMVTEGEQSGAIGHDQSTMIRNVLEFGDTQAGDLMVPRPRVTAIDANIPPNDLVDLIRKHEHSRYPVYRDRIDNIIGILHVKDVFLFSAARGMEQLTVRDLLRKAVFIPETQLASSVLQQLRSGRHHMAIVIDEYGGMSGILTLEDLLEEIVGEINDEYDDEESPIVELSNGHFVVDASIPIAELARQAGIELPDGDEYNSLGGFIVEVMGRVPESGAVLEKLGHRFLIRSADERRISKVEIVPAA